MRITIRGLFLVQQAMQAIEQHDIVVGSNRTLNVSSYDINDFSMLDSSLVFTSAIFPENLINLDDEYEHDSVTESPPKEPSQGIKKDKSRNTQRKHKNHTDTIFTRDADGNQ